MPRADRAAGAHACPAGGRTSGLSCRGAGPITLKAHDFRVRRFGGGVEIFHAAELDSTRRDRALRRAACRPKVAGSRIYEMSPFKPGLD